ncbi:hypothetical protein FisN_33Lh036 [Fistulifera solaris]|uniref:HSF-type DNA-binding domain-containing protein n=1 Tax=Fistulifera solaris TaxID=1519565 RepID=A0A1Z5KA72_FISSO|nr:hypothetical protein FisN_33Lh036 [Fistulifera solaris]|eukprot:GAX23144.1 hypothetical protein FisN_33Lh036 [Fistulifera solaris]
MKRNRLTDSEADRQANDRKEATAQPSPSSAESQIKGKNLLTFPHRLYSLLSDKQYENAIKWSSDGKSFGVMPLEFTNLVLNVHFRGSQFESFIRKLNRWCFTRNAINSEFPVYAVVHSHPLFQRDRPDLLEAMTCVSKNKKRKEDHSFSEEAKEAVVPSSVAASGGIIDQMTASLVNRDGLNPDITREATLAQNIRLAQILRGGMQNTIPQLSMNQLNLLSLASSNPPTMGPVESLLLLEQERLAMARNRNLVNSRLNQMDYLLRNVGVDPLLGPSRFPNLLLGGGFEPSIPSGASSAFVPPMLVSQAPGPIARLLSSRLQQKRGQGENPHDPNAPYLPRDDSHAG